ncbi:MAG TPA: aspartyl protease family protein [Rhizomicrobium sp.]|nr:aspartyl protease family protein [Rhizomicrobium sp.]
MRTNFATFAFAASAVASSIVAAPAYATTAADVLAANKAATGGAAWDGKASLHETFDFVGQGMTGTAETDFDLSNGRFVDNLALGPLHIVQGYDGAGAWAKDPSGTITPQNGAGRVFAVNEAYRDANLWWRADFGGAQVSLEAPRTVDGTRYDVVHFVPKDGGPFDALFDPQTHLLARIDEKQGSLTLMTTLSDYRSFDGAMIAGKQDQIASDGKNPQTMTLKDARFEAVRPDAFYAMPKVVLADYAIAGGKETTFPFRLVNNHIYADVKINGTGPYVFIFDTGGLNLVTPTLAQKLGLKVEGALDARGGGSETMKAGMTKVARVDLGNATITDQSFMTLPLDSMAHVEGMEMPGMIGFETFRRFVTRVDYGAKTITLMDPKDFDPSSAGTAVPIAFDGNDIEIEGSYDGIPGKFVIDTGARQSLMLTTPFVEKNRLHDASVKSEEATTGWGIGGPTKAYVIRRGVLKLGSVVVDKPLTLLTTDKGGANAEDLLAGNIGGGVLKRFVVTFDYERGTMYLKPVAGAVADLDTFDRSGLWLNEDADGFKIVDVTAKAPGAEAGLAAGDVVTAVDGKPAKSIALPDLRQRLRNDKPGTVVVFAVKGKGDIKVTLRELI